MNLPGHLSASQINTFIGCPYKWLCGKLDKPRVKVEEKFMIFGRGIHESIDLYYQKLKDMEDNWEELIEEAFSEGTNWANDSMAAKTKRVKRNFMLIERERNRKKLPAPELVEKRMTVEIFDGLPPLVLIPDAYYDGIIRDWKTGRRTDMGNDWLIQGKIYQMGLEKEGYPVKRVVFNCLDAGLEVCMPRISDGWLQKQVEQVCNMIEGDRFPSKPNEFCKWCPFILSCQLKHKCSWSR